MTFFNQSTDLAQQSSPPTTDVDRVLRCYFDAAMPDPWPGCPPCEPEAATADQPRKFGSGRWLRAGSRLAVAAAVAGLVISYVTLQSSFPETKRGAKSNIDISRPTAFRLPEPGSSIEHTKSGQPVGVEVEPTKNPKTINILIKELPAKKLDR